MKLRGQDTEDGFREWVKTEIKEGPKQGYELGKFFFSVSVGTVGALAALEKLNTNANFDIVLFCSVLFLFVSMLVGLHLAVPRKRIIGGETDLLEEYEARARWITRRIWIWFVLWLVGTAIGGFAVRH